MSVAFIVIGGATPVFGTTLGAICFGVARPLAESGLVGIRRRITRSFASWPFRYGRRC